MKVKLINYTSVPLLMIATAAAITRGLNYRDYGSKTSLEEMQKLVKECYDSGHWSVFEFADFDFEVEGASRVFEAQAIRSRHASFEWESGRHDQWYKPVNVKNHALENFIHVGIDNYDYLVHDMDISSELARYALPQGVARKGRIKRNFRNLLETSMIRLCSHAQEEYREFMEECKRLVTLVDPFLGSLLVPKCEYYGYCNEAKSCRRNGVLTKEEALRKLYEVR